MLLNIKMFVESRTCTKYLFTTIKNKNQYYFDVFCNGVGRGGVPGGGEVVCGGRVVDSGSCVGGTVAGG